MFHLCDPRERERERELDSNQGSELEVSQRWGVTRNQETVGCGESEGSTTPPLAAGHISPVVRRAAEANICFNLRPPRRGPSSPSVGTTRADQYVRSISVLTAAAGVSLNIIYLPCRDGRTGAKNKCRGIENKKREFVIVDTLEEIL